MKMNTCGSPVRWTEIEQRLRPYIRSRVAREVDAEDVLQDVLLRAFRGLGTLREEERFEGWIRRITRHAIADHLRSRPRESASLEPHLAGTETGAEAMAPDDEEDGAAARQLSQCVSGFVAALPSPYREAITLTELEGRTQREAAEMLGISLSAAKSRVQRGRVMLRDMFERCCEIELDSRGRVVDYSPRKC